MAAGYLMNGEYLLVKERARTIREPALYASSGFNLSGKGSAERLQGAYVSTNLFSLLGVAPVLGRAFVPGEDRPGSDRVVVISHALWQQRFGADPGVVGRTILVDGEPRTVVGVMPRGLDFPAADTRLWVPATIDPSNPANLWGGAGGQVIARLAAGATPARAQAELHALVPELRRANTLWVPAPEYRASWTVAPLQETIVRDVRSRLLILLAAAGLVLLIACANVANLLLARASARQREMAVRNALGAGRPRLIRQLLTESAVLGFLGCALGLLLAVGGVKALVAALPAEVPRVAEIEVDRWVLGFTLAVGVLATLLVGLIPALRSSRPDAQSALRSGGRSTSAGQRRLAGALVTTEFALAVMLVIAAGLLIRSFAALVHVDPGFRTEHIITARITPPEARYGDGTKQRAFYAALLGRVSALPGVRSVDAVSRLPLAGGFTGVAFEVEGKPYRPGTVAPVFDDRRITPGYPQTMGIRLLAGRPLTDADREGAPKVALVNEAMARKFWPGEDPVGKRFKEVWLPEWTTVVGVVGNVKSRGLASETEPQVYRPFAQAPTLDMSLVVRTTGDPDAVIGSLRAAVAAVDADVPVSEIRMVEQMITSSVAAPRFTMLLLAAFAAVALLLAAIGIYGVISYAVTRRTPEIGLRVALGAQRGHVLRMVLRQALVLAVIGAVVGLGAALATTRALRSLLFGVSATDGVTLIAVPLLLMAVALLAAYLPARRAARVDPMIALRAE